MCDGDHGEKLFRNGMSFRQYLGVCCHANMNITLISKKKHRMIAGDDKKESLGN